MRIPSVLAAVAATAAALTALALPAPSGASAAAHVPECRSSDLHARFVDEDAAAGSSFGRLVLRNVSSHTCSVQGFGGLSYVGHGDGTQVGHAAGRTRSRHPVVVLRPGRRAVSEVRIASPYDYPATTCRRTHVDGFRVYPPDSRTALFVSHPGVTCANRTLHLLEHRAYRRP